MSYVAGKSIYLKGYKRNEFAEKNAELHISIYKNKERSCVHIRKVYSLRGIKLWYTSRLIGTGCRCFKLEDWPFIILLTIYLEV